MFNEHFVPFTMPFPKGDHLLTTKQFDDVTKDHGRHFSHTQGEKMNYALTVNNIYIQGGPEKRNGILPTIYGCNQFQCMG